MIDAGKYNVMSFFRSPLYGFFTVESFFFNKVSSDQNETQVRHAVDISRGSR